MKRIFNPMLFLMANTPDVERNMELLTSLLQTAADSVKNIKNGFDNFNATMIKVAEGMPGSHLNQNKPAGPAEPAAHPKVPTEPAHEFDPAPSIQMPDEEV
ncbi:MAG: hypothetical protein PHP51_01865 [Desulfotomaculaceae bacterium]|nr:hypothetical protein [Desulfotomaculaceae bacterium]MDD4766595.1 hypothetical protein [Desulfotomaculaceae bacterium]